MGSESRNDFSTPSQAFSPGTLKNVPYYLNEPLVNFREGSSDIGRLSRFEFLMDGQLRPIGPVSLILSKPGKKYETGGLFRVFFIETGRPPVSYF